MSKAPKAEVRAWVMIQFERSHFCQGNKNILQPYYSSLQTMLIYYFPTGHQDLLLGENHEQQSTILLKNCWCLNM